MTDSNYTDITVVLDRSGSMASLRKDMEGGFDQFVKEQGEQPGKCLLTLTQFDDKYEVVYTGKPISEVPPLTLIPRGRTALLDAIGRTITTTGERLAALGEDDRPGNVIFMIITDGLENASREWNRDRVLEAVTRQTNEFNWTFTYLGANQDAIAVGGGIGVAAASTMDYDASAKGAQSMYAAASAAVTRTRGGGQFDYTEDERRKAAQKTP
jgi:hypothetical protein